MFLLELASRMPLVLRIKADLAMQMRDDGLDILLFLPLARAQLQPLFLLALFIVLFVLLKLLRTDPVVRLRHLLLSLFLLGLLSLLCVERLLRVVELILEAPGFLFLVHQHGLQFQDLVFQLPKIEFAAVVFMVDLRDVSGELLPGLNLERNTPLSYLYSLANSASLTSIFSLSILKSLEFLTTSSEITIS